MSCVAPSCFWYLKVSTRQALARCPRLRLLEIAEGGAKSPSLGTVCTLHGTQTDGILVA